MPDASTPPTPGYRTTEFWFRQIALLLSVLIATDAIPVGGVTMKIVMIAAAWLTAEGYTVSRTIIKTAAPMFLFAAIVHSAACGASARDSLIATTVSAADAAEATFHVYDTAHQVDLARAAKDADDARASIDRWRVQRDRIDRDIATVYRACALAVVANDNASADAMAKAINIVRDELRALGVAP
jgi:hypothetical protein